MKLMKIRKPVVGKMAVTAVIVIVAVGVYAVWVRGVRKGYMSAKWLWLKIPV